MLGKPKEFKTDQEPLVAAPESAVLQTRNEVRLNFVTTIDKPGKFSWVQDLRLKIKRALQKQTPEVKEETDFLRWIESRLKRAKLTNLYHEADPSFEDFVVRYYHAKYPLIMEARTRFLDFVRGNDKMTPEEAGDMTERFFDETAAVDTLYALALTSSLDPGQTLHLNDICGGEGTDGFLTQLFREGAKGETFIACYDNSPEKRKNFEMLRDNVFMACKGTRFNYGDIAATPNFFKMPNARNVWLAKSPARTTGVLTKKIIALDESETPDSIAMFPCDCCSYDPEFYPDDGEVEVSQKEWNIMRSIMQKRKDAPNNDTPERRNLITTRKLMDLVRASFVNRNNPNLKAQVCATLGDNRAETMILIRSNSPHPPPSNRLRCIFPRPPRRFQLPGH